VDRNVQTEMERKLWEKIAAGHGVDYAECGERYRHRICYGIADDAQRATQDAVDNGRCTDEQVETVFWSEYDCKYLEAYYVKRFLVCAGWRCWHRRRRVSRATGRQSFTRSPFLRAMTRNPSCLISCSHISPEGVWAADVGRHGAMKPAGKARKRNDMRRDRLS
jgi:hypothetical protein